MPPALRPYNTSDTPARGVSFLHWKSRDRPAAPLAELTQICPHQRPLGSRGSPSSSSQQWPRPAVVQGSGSCSPAGTWSRRAPFLVSAVNQRSHPQGFGTGRHRGTGTGAGGSRAGWADPRLGQTQGAWLRQDYCLTSVAFLCGTLRIVFLRSEGVIMNYYHIMKTYKSVISHSL